jgi:hypothetical protein
MALNAAASLSASSFVAFSLRVFGSDSTNFLACRRGYLALVLRPTTEEGMTRLYEVHSGHDGLDLLDGLCLLGSVNLCQVDVEDGLFLWCGLFGFLGGASCGGGGGGGGSGGHGNVDNVEARLEGVDEVGGFEEGEGRDLVDDAGDFGRVVLRCCWGRRRRRRGGGFGSRFGADESARREGGGGGAAPGGVGQGELGITVSPCLYARGWWSECLRGRAGEEEL